MSATLPFNVSPEAEEYLHRVAVLPNKEPGISLAFRMMVYNRAGELTACYDGPHFGVGWHEPGVGQASVLGLRVESFGWRLRQSRRYETRH